MTTKNRILLLANYRTGSSSYCHALAKNNNIDCFPEPHMYEDSYKLLQTLLIDNKPFVTKFMPDQIDSHPLYQEILNSDCYKIKLTRENKIDQIASYYTADATNIWNSSNNLARGENYVVKIVKEYIDIAIDTITKNDNLINNLDIKFDEELTYEQLASSNIVGSYHTKILEPVNILHIKKAIEKIMITA